MLKLDILNPAEIFSIYQSFLKEVFIGFDHQPRDCVERCFESLTGIWLKHDAGNIPVWFAPAQVVVLNFTGQQPEYTMKIGKKLKNQGFRVIYDLRN